MPSYDFECRKCRRQFTAAQSFEQHDHQKPKCPHCGSRDVRQLISEIHVKTSKKS
jgi:putative FmdB family regulatory protein